MVQPIAESSNQYENEQVASTYGYYSGYVGNRSGTIETIIADFEVQAKKLDGWLNCGTHFNPDLIVRMHRIVPDWVEKFFAQFAWQHLAPTYGEAVEKVFDMIKQTRNGAFFDYRKSQLGSNHLRESSKQVALFQQLAREQKDQSILLVPAQFGIRHRGRSVRRVREVMSENECGLGTFANGIMLLTHPERLMHHDDLWIDCAGDEFALGSSAVPSFKIGGNRVRFGPQDVAYTDEKYGSASVCLPQG